MVKLCEMCEFLPKSKRAASFGQPTGAYNFYTSSDKVQRCDIADYTEEALIVGSGGVANIKLDKNFSCSDHHFVLKGPHMRYFYHLIKANIGILADGFQGSTLKNLSKAYLLNLQVPLCDEPQLSTWLTKLNTLYNTSVESSSTIKQLEALIADEIKKITAVDYDEVKLGDLCKVLPGTKHCSNIAKSDGKFKFYNSSQASNLYVDFCEIKEHSIIIGQGGIVSVHYDVNFTPSKHVSVLQKKSNVNLNYIYHILKYETQSFKVNGSVIKWLNKENIKEFKIKIPKNKSLIDRLNPLFDKLAQVKNIYTTANTEYQKAAQELSRAAFPETSDVPEVPGVLNEQDLNAKSTFTQLIDGKLVMVECGDSLKDTDKPIINRFKKESDLLDDLNDLTSEL
jgi:hypothetical protein